MPYIATGRLRWIAWFSALLIVQACGETQVPGGPPPRTGGADSESAGSSGESGAGGSAGGGRAGAGGSDESLPPRGRRSEGDTDLPCEVADVFQTSCQGCHARDPGLLAPMALVTRDDLVAPSISDPKRAVRELVAERIHDPERPMPPASSRKLTAEELGMLDAFLAAGAPAGDVACEKEPPDAGPPDPPDDIGECYRFTAHDLAVADDTTPFRVDPGEHYACFYFGVPWPADSQALSMRSLDSNLTHHWQLYHTVEPHQAGQILRGQSSCGFDLREVLGVYSHGEERETRMPDGVGLELPPPTDNHGILLEIHYYNPGEVVGDTTGVEVCTAKTPRPNVASFTVIGAPLFNLPAGQRTTVHGTCTPAYDGEIHVFRSFPHMHARGISMDTTIVRADGARELLLDEAFDFNNQRMYETPAILRTGDRLETRCHYMNDTDRPITAGFSADEEMCNHFLYAWPAGAISNGAVGGTDGLCLF